MLAAELTIEMGRSFTAQQVIEKFQRLKIDWSISDPKLPCPTGNVTRTAMPCHYDIMLEYWGDKNGCRRDSMFSTDENVSSQISEQSDIFDFDKSNDETTLVNLDSAADEKEMKISKHGEKKTFSRQNEREKQGRTKSHADAIGTVFLAIKDGLVSLSNAMIRLYKMILPSHMKMVQQLKMC
ncbi:hypothetical protein AC1031_018467 [Aphanomyces cochlioides]|nr:hypothetical protein AC1031_018467 [Aphanomyces cochlioides]